MHVNWLLRQNRRKKWGQILYIKGGLQHHLIKFKHPIGCEHQSENTLFDAIFPHAHAVIRDH